MSDEQPSVDIVNIWLNQSVKGESMSLEDMQARANKFQAEMRRQMIPVYASSIFVLISCSYALWAIPLWTLKVGYSLLLAATAFVLWQQRQWNASKARPDTGTVPGLIQFHRRELVRWYDLYRSSALKSSMPFIPGLCFVIGGHYAQLQHILVSRTGVLLLTLGIVIAVLAFAFGWQSMKIQALKLQREIEEFDRLTAG